MPKKAKAPSGYTRNPKTLAEQIERHLPASPRENYKDFEGLGFYIGEARLIVKALRALAGAR